MALKDNISIYYMNTENKRIIRKKSIIKESKEIKEKLSEYLNYLLTREIPKKNKLINKIHDTTFVIPDVNEYELLLDNFYTMEHLRQICKFYKCRLSGNKSQIIVRIYNFLYLTHNIIKIQKVWLGFLQRKLNKYHGPALFKRDICVNETDFYTLDKLSEIPLNQFFSLKDDKNFIYGFNIISIYNLFIKNGSKTKNPYNKTIFQPEVFNNIKNFVKLSKILKKNTEINIKDDNYCNDINMRILSLFQFIDSLGNYTETKWFTDLTGIKLIIYLKELYDIWNYRAELDINIKKEVCPPFGDPFRELNFSTINSHSYTHIQKRTLSVMEKLVLSGTTMDNKILGAYYVLCGLTLVSDDAAEALPWLYQSVALS